MAQQFQGTNYFWPRPSACTYGSESCGDRRLQSASNLGPTERRASDQVIVNNISAFFSGNNLSTNTVVPVDMVYASASGLDPHISPESARLQIARVALSRGISEAKVKALVEQYVEPPQLGFLGEPRVNVLLLNVALDQLSPLKVEKAPAKPEVVVDETEADSADHRQRPGPSASCWSIAGGARTATRFSKRRTGNAECARPWMNVRT